MLSASSDPELQKEGASCMGCTAFPIAAFSGAYANGQPFATLFLEGVGAALAGSPWKDGIDVGGWPWDPQVVMPNVEEFESSFPILYLWKRVLPDSGGAGRFRGGNSMDLGVVVHGVETIAHHTASAAHCAVPARRSRAATRRASTPTRCCATPTCSSASPAARCRPRRRRWPPGRARPCRPRPSACPRAPATST